MVALCLHPWDRVWHSPGHSNTWMARAPEGWREAGALGQRAQALPGLSPHPSAKAPAGCQSTPMTHPGHSDAGDGQQQGWMPRLYLSKI